MIRFILVVLIVLLYLIVGIPILLIEWLIGKINPRARDISSLRMVQGIFKFILWVTGAKIDYIGHENVPKDQAVLYVGNHSSYFDILLKGRDAQISAAPRLDETAVLSVSGPQ